jgi:TolA-binding protein
MILFLSGCYFTRERIQYRDNYFRPVGTVQKKNLSQTSSADVDQIKTQLALAAKAAVILRDSLSALTEYSGSLLFSTRQLVDKVNELEKKEMLAVTKQSTLESNIEELRSENKQLAQQLNELRVKIFSEAAPAQKQDMTPASMSITLKSEYSKGIVLFQKHLFDQAHEVFEDMLEKGIEEDLADNCTYWKGECRFAKQEYRDAVENFQNVLLLKTSNKKDDAYFMLAKSYENLGDVVKARWAYEELLLLYPGYKHAKAISGKLDVLKKSLPQPASGGKHKKSAI